MSKVDDLKNKYKSVSNSSFSKFEEADFTPTKKYLDFMLKTWEDRKTEAPYRTTGIIIDAVNKAVERFGGIDILINNASAISLTTTEATESKRVDIMHDINVRGTFLVSKHCIPHLKKGANPHILNLSPPINMDPKWLGNHLAYTMSKYNMSMMAIGLAEELKPMRIAANALWPRTTIATAAVMNLLGGQMLINMSRTPEIIADAAYAILTRPSSTCTGNLYLDEDVLAEEGVTDLSGYSVVPGATLYTDLFL